MPNMFSELVATSFTFRRLGNFYSSNCGRCGGRNGCGAENKTSGTIDQIVDQYAAATNKPAARAKRFAKRAHLNLNLAANSQRIGEAAPMSAENSRCVSFVHHEPCSVFFLEGNHFFQRSRIAVHAKNTFSNNEHVSSARGVGGQRLNGRRRPLQFILQIVQVIMIKDSELRAGKPRRINDRSMNELIQNDDVILVG